MTLGPPIFGFSSPLTARIESRIASPSSRRRENRHNNLSSGSTAAARASYRADCSYVLANMINRCSFFNDHVVETSDASQSSKARFDGFSPVAPKSLGVPTSPRPKWYCHTRFTMTRAVRGFFGLINQAASADRLPVGFSAQQLSGGNGSEFRIDGTPGSTSWIGL